MALSRYVRSLSFSVGLAGVLGAALSGCGGGGGGFSNPINNGGFVVPGATPFVTGALAGRRACQANPHMNGRARWTVLVYMNAASNLQPDSLINIAQMAAVGSSADLNIIVQWKQTAANNFFSSVAVD